MHGPRHVLLAFVAAFLATAVIVAGLRADPSVPTFPGSRQLGEWNIAHQTSAVHVAGVVRGFGVRATDVVDITNAALNVNCVVGCSGSSAANPIPHITSVTHVFGFVRIVNSAGTNATFTSTSLDVNCTAGCSGGVNTPVNQSGIWIVSATHIANAPSVGQSGSWSIQAAHQAGEWNVRHVSSLLHVVVVDWQPWLHLSVRHISSTIHLAGSVTDQNNKALRVIAADAFNINHVTSMLHVSGQVEIVGRPRGPTNWVDVEANAMMVNVTQAAHISGSLHIAGTIKGAQFHVTGLGIPGQTHGGVFTIQGVTGMIPVKVDQNTLPWTIAHMSAVVHVSVMNSERSRLGMHITDAVCLTCKARVDHYDVLVVQPHISGSLVAWRVAECGTTQATVVPTNANRRDLMIRNVGSRPVYVGYGTTGHVALTIANGYPLHAMSTTSANAVPFENHYTASQKELNLPNYNGPLRCIAPGASQLAVLEILR